MKQEKPGLLQVLGIGFGVAILVGNSIGIGILRMPGTIASYLHSEWLIIGLWIGVGLICLLGGAIYGEAAVAYPFSGGPYAITQHVFGKMSGFMVGCCDWLLNTSGNAALAIAASDYFIALSGSSMSRAALASMTIIVLSAIQWFGMQSSSIIQNSLSVLKALGLLFVVGAFFMHGKATDMHSVAAVVHHSPVTLFGAMILSMRAIFFSYQGWNAPIYFTEENEDPVRSIPRSLIWGVISLTIIYVLVNASMLYLMPLSAIANSPLAVGVGADIVFGHHAKMVVTIISIVIVLSGLYPSVLYAPRIIFGMSRSGIFFPFASIVNRYAIPGRALIASGVVAILFAVSGTFEFVIAITTFLYLFVDTSVYVSSLYARWYKKTAFPFLTPGFPAAHIVMVLVNLTLLISIAGEDHMSSIYGALITLSTAPLYLIFKKIESVTKNRLGK